MKSKIQCEVQLKKNIKDYKIQLRRMKYLYKCEVKWNIYIQM